MRELSHELPLGLTLGVSDAANYGLTGIPPGPYDAGIPPVYISNLTNLGTKDYRPGYQVTQVFQFVDDLYKLLGKHSLQFGYEFHQNSLNFFDIEAPQGTITSSGIYSNTNGFGVADFLMGDVAGTIYDTGAGLESEQLHTGQLDVCAGYVAHHTQPYSQLRHSL